MEMGVLVVLLVGAIYNYKTRWSIRLKLITVVNK